MKIRQTTLADLPVLMEAFAYGRQLQRLLGNHYQWKDGYPSQALLEQDILSGNSYVCVIDRNDTMLEPGTIVGTFYMAEVELPVFQTIHQGAWISEETYVTIQRLCTNGKRRGVSRFCLNWVTEHYPNIRIYTHETNKPMIHVIEKTGFHYCGRIMPEDGEPRQAYQFNKANQMREVM